MARKKSDQPLVAPISLDHLPRDVKESIERMVGKGSTVAQIQKHIKENGFSVNKPALKSWIAKLPIKRVESVHDLPEDLQKKVESWWLTRRDFAACIRDLADAGYKADILTLRRWYRDLLRDEASAELSGAFDPSKTSISKELEAWGLTGVLDAAVDAIIRSSATPKLTTASDFARIADVIIKTVNANVSRRKLDMDDESLMDRARSEFDAKIRHLLSGHPELVKQLMEVADEAEELLVAK